MNQRLLVTLSIVTALGANAWAGLSFTSVTTMEGGIGRGDQPSTTNVVLDGDRLRMEVAGERKGHAAEGYFLTQDGGKTLFMVSPKDKTYMKWDMENMMGPGGMMGMAKGMMNMKFSNVKVEKLAEGPGEPIQGFATTHYRFRTSYQISTSFMGRQNVSTVVRDEDLWTAPKLNPAVMSVWARKQMPATGDEEFDKLMKSERAKATGLPLRMIATTTTTDAAGKAQVTKSTTEVTEVKQGAVDAALLELPKDYQETQMPKMPPMPGGMGK